MTSTEYQRFALGPKTFNFVFCDKEPNAPFNTLNAELNALVRLPRPANLAAKDFESIPPLEISPPERATFRISLETSQENTRLSPSSFSEAFSSLPEAADVRIFTISSNVKSRLSYKCCK